MQKRGCSELDEIEEKDVLSFFLSDAGKLIRGCSYKKNVAAVFKAGLHWKKEPCSRILTFLPALRENRKTIQYLTEEETNRIRDALRNTEAQLSLRDRAVGTLLLYTGLRGCDIAGLLFESIDWDREIQMSWIHKEYGRALLGMAHGNAGIALAYGKLYEITGEFKYADRLEKVILYEHRRYNERTGDWYDYQKPEEIRETHEDAAAWCHGAGGILSSRLELQKINLSEGLQEILDVDIKRAVERVKGHFMRNSLCLCHGIGGNLLILQKYLTFYKDADAGILCKSMYTYICNCLQMDKIDLIREKYGMGFMTGYGGILYSIMKK